jgi:hypothetical protein
VIIPRATISDLFCASIKIEIAIPVKTESELAKRAFRCAAFRNLEILILSPPKLMPAPDSSVFNRIFVVSAHAEDLFCLVKARDDTRKVFQTIRRKRQLVNIPA